MKAIRLIQAIVMVLTMITVPCAEATVIDFAVMPEAKQRPEIWPSITEALMTAKKGDAIILTDPRAGSRVAGVTISEEVAEAPSPQARTNWLTKKYGGQIAQMKRFLTTTEASQTGTGSFTRFVRDLELLKTEFPGQPIQAAFYGSPLQLEPAALSMVNRYPADNLLLIRDSIFCVVGHEHALQGVTVHVVHSPNLSEFSERNRDFHEEKVKRFFGMFIEEQGGNLASFSGSAEHLRRIATANYPKVDYGHPEMGDGKPVIFEVLSPAIERHNKSLHAGLWDARTVPIKPPPSRPSAPLDISITWSRNIDLDIYVKAENDAELYFARTASATYGGRFLNDIRSLPGTNVFETVTYAGDVPLKSLQVYINHYAGASDAPVEIEVRIRVLGSIYAKTVHLAAGHGSKGGGDRNHDPSWVRVNAAEIMGLQ